jgi:excisionase family DNA binding protein
MNMKGKDVARTPRYAVPTRLMTVRDLSVYLHVHKSTIYRMLRQREIPAFRIGSDWRFNIESVDRWCSEQTEHKQPRNGSVLCEERAAAGCKIVDVDAQAKALRPRMYFLCSECARLIDLAEGNRPRRHVEGMDLIQHAAEKHAAWLVLDVPFATRSAQTVQ